MMAGRDVGVPEAALIAAIRGLYHAGRAHRPTNRELEAACGLRSLDRVRRVHRRLIETGEVPGLPAAPVARAGAAARGPEAHERAGRRPGRWRGPPPRRRPVDEAEGAGETIWRRTIREAMQRERARRSWAGGRPAWD